MAKSRVGRANSPRVVQKLRAGASSVPIERFSGILNTELSSSADEQPSGRDSARGAATRTDAEHTASIPGFDETLKKLEGDRNAYAESRRSAKTRGTILFTD